MSTNIRVLFDNSPLHPGKILRQLLEQKGWSQEELSAITGRSRQTISEIISGRSGITPDMAITLAAAFGNRPAEWLKWDTHYRLSIVEGNASEVEKKARLFEIAPIREMQKREWIKSTTDLGELEAELKVFFGSESLDGDLPFPVAARRTTTLAYLSSAEKAWCFRARQLARALVVGAFSHERLPAAEKKLRQLAAYPKEVRHLPQVLSEYGIRFVVIEPLPGVRIDGAAFWIDESPGIALSVRHDRIDAFWFTLMHEFAHIRNGDALSIDTDLVDGVKGIAVMLVQDEAERRANEQAASSLIPAHEIDSFIRRVGPLYSKERIIQFAHKIRVHPGIIVGQLQHREEIGYSTNREMLVKVRSTITETALTDGWNRSISPASL